VIMQVCASGGLKRESLASPAWPRSPGRADSTQIPDSPAAFLESSEGNRLRSRASLAPCFNPPR
jgi:hypothetical protein